MWRKDSHPGWRWWQQQIGIAGLLPEVYAKYEPLLADGLRFFLERLSSKRLRRIITAQMQLSPMVSAAERLVAVLEHIPALHKLGQVVARDKRLSAGFRRRLQQLESMQPRYSQTAIVRSLDKEFKDWRKAGIEPENEPLAEGSVAVVIPFRWRDGHPTKEGVFKLLKPGIEQALDEDLDILGEMGHFLDEDCARYHFPALDYYDAFNTIRDLLAHEIHLEQEQKHLAEAASIYKGMSSVLVPALFPFCSPRLTAMERVHGQKLTDHTRSPATLGRTIADALIAMPMFSSRPAALFHADPHAGNLFLTPDNRVAILDWSLVGRLGREERSEIAQLMLGALTLDIDRMEDSVKALAHGRSDSELLREALRISLRRLHWGTFPGVTWLTDLLDQIVMSAGLRPSPNLLLFRKVLLTLEGVLSDVTHSRERARSVMDEAVVGAFMHHWINEWPAAFRRPLLFRSFTTHLSTADLLSLFNSGPATFSRWWNQTLLDLFTRA